MKQCKKCHVKVRTDEDVCPLCQNKLVGSKIENIFPYVPTIKKRFSLFFKILLLVSIIISLICVAIDYALNKYHFSLLVVFGFVLLSSFAFLLICFLLSFARSCNMTY